MDNHIYTGIDILFGELNGSYDDWSIRRDGNRSGGLFSRNKRNYLAPRDIQQYFDDLQFAIGIVEDLNLNLRIWSKRPDVSKEPAKVVYNLDGTVNYSNEEVEWIEPTVSPKDTLTKTETVYGVPYWKKD